MTNFQPDTTGAAASRNGNMRRMRRRRRAFLCAALSLLACACASLSRPPETGQPRAGQPPYPVILGASEERRERALATWTTLSGVAGATHAPAPELQPVTATLRALPTADAPPALLRLPRVGGEEDGTQTEEELRESLRRFIAGASPLLGIDTPQETLSLVERKDNPDGTRRALYQQKPFPYPLRAGYGVLDISFALDLRVTALSSTAIPDAQRLRRALANAPPQLTARDALLRLAGRPFAYADAGGVQQTFTLASPEAATVREMVVYPLRPADESASLALHLAWEVAVGSDTATPLLVYVDAVTGDTIAAATAPAKTDANASPLASPTGR